MREKEREINVIIIERSAEVQENFKKIFCQEEDVVVKETVFLPPGFKKTDRWTQADAVLLDLEIPGFDSLAYLETLVSKFSLPVIVTCYQEREEFAVRAMEIGAVDFLFKPAFTTKEKMDSQSSEIIFKVKNAVKNKKHQGKSGKKGMGKAPIEQSYIKTVNLDKKVIAIGASTGGTMAVKSVLSRLPHEMPGIMVIMHMPAGFTDSFARALNRVLPLTVKEAVDGESFLPGKVYIAPGDRHMLLWEGAQGYYLQVDSEPPVNYYRPSLDKSFFTLADIKTLDKMGIILTGMGSDGVEGLKKMRQKGALTVAQEEKSCSVYGMPRQAVAVGAVEKLLSLDSIAEFAVSFAGGRWSDGSKVEQ